MPNPSPATRILRLLISLEGTEPRVWRRLEIANGIILPWFHCFQFMVRGRAIGVPAAGTRPQVQDGTTRRLDRLELRVGEVFHYVHDLDREWRHEIRVEAVFQPEAGIAYPRLTGGSGTCPGELTLGPEDHLELTQLTGEEEVQNPDSDIYWTEREDLVRTSPFILGPANRRLQKVLKARVYS
jgi:hypothetical protein